MKDGPDDGQAEWYSAEFKAKVAMEALRGELTASQLATEHGVHQTMIGDWKRQAVEGLVSVFSGKAETKEGIGEEELEKLHAKIGQLVVERDFLAKALRSMSVEQRRGLIEPGHGQLSIVRQCELVSISRSSFYYQPTGETAETLALMRLIDAQFLEPPGMGRGRWRGTCDGMGTRSAASGCGG